jgi:hypothetical protein
MAKPSLAVVVAPAPKRAARDRSSSATTPAVPAEPPARSRSRTKDKDPADTPAPKATGPFKPASKLLVNEIAGKILEAVKIDGFDREDAVKAVKILQQLEDADRKETTKLNDQLRGLYRDNYKAMKSYNAREAADGKSKRQKA